MVQWRKSLFHAITLLPRQPSTKVNVGTSSKDEASLKLAAKAIQSRVHPLENRVTLMEQISAVGDQNGKVSFYLKLLLGPFLIFCLK